MIHRLHGLACTVTERGLSVGVPTRPRRVLETVRLSGDPDPDGDRGEADACANSVARYANIGSIVKYICVGPCV